MTENATATLATYVTDMQALISHGLGAIDRQVENLKRDKEPQALAAVQEFQRTLRAHLSLLDARAKALGGKATQPIKRLAATVTGLFAGLMNAVRPEKAAKAIRDDYTFLSHAAISYLMLFTTASGLGDEDTASLAHEGYRDAARLVMLIDRVMPGLVVRELSQDGLPMADVEGRVLEMIPRAWQREFREEEFRASPPV